MFDSYHSDTKLKYVILCRHSCHLLFMVAHVLIGLIKGDEQS